jgi:hypothetical protein
LANSTAQQLRDKVKEIRTKPIPISDLIPLLLKAADELDVVVDRNSDLEMNNPANYYGEDYEAV